MTTLNKTYTSEHCIQSCKNFDIPKVLSVLDFLEIRHESWVFVVFAIFGLGILFCIAILVFLIACIFRGDVLEGNPVMTVFLLMSVLFIYSSVLPFTIQTTKNNENLFCLLKTIWTTLSFCAAFSLILARCILLSTVSKDIVFMSHISGSLQSFLSLFIFGVQVALTLQITDRCKNMFCDLTYIYVSSYNSMLLLLALCVCPLIYKSQRNYKEGKYYTIAIVLINVCWGIWMTCFGLLEDYWKEPLICMGALSTGSILIGAVFVPRTYSMTGSAARNKITNTLPSLGASASMLDIYKRNTQQPIYDCVNVAAINAVSVARAGIAPQNLYNCPTFQEDEDFDFEERAPSSPLNADKVTRF